MNTMKKRRIISYAVSAGAILSLAIILAMKEGILEHTAAKDIFRIISDAMIIPGVLAMGVAAISWAGSLGTFDMIGYGVRCLFFFLPKEKEKRPKTFYDYKVKKDESGRHWLTETLIVGGGATVLGIISLTVYFVI